MQWFWFEAVVNGQRKYLGKCRTTRKTIKEKFANYLLLFEPGNLVVIFGQVK